MYYLLVRPNPEVWTLSGTPTPIEDCWFDPSARGRGAIRSGQLPNNVQAPVTKTVIRFSNGVYTYADGTVNISANGQSAYEQE